MRAPLLAVALGIIGIAAVGWPGFVSWDARASLVELTIAGPIGYIVILSSIAQLAIYIRLFVVGLSRPSEIVRAGDGGRPKWPVAVTPRDRVGLSRAERMFERGGHVVNGALDVAWAVPAVFRANRGLLVGVLALAMAGLAFTVAAGGLGVVEAARAVPGQQSGPGPGEGEGQEPVESLPVESVPIESCPIESVPVESPSSEPQPSGSPLGVETAPSSPTTEPSFQPVPSP